MEQNSLKLGSSHNLIDDRSVNWCQFKDPLCNMCFPGTVAASQSLI